MGTPWLGAGLILLLLLIGVTAASFSQRQRAVHS
jgi:predicted ribosomally synthesized peptide with SipW-like signal peptide